MFLNINWFLQGFVSEAREVANGPTSERLCLCDLVVVLQNKKMGRIVRKPVNQHQQLDNVIKALRAIENDNVRLVNIGKFLTLDD